VAFLASKRRCVGRLSQVSYHTGPLELLDYVTPPGASLESESDAVLTVEAGKPPAEMDAVGLERSCPV
jgi:hypothetical protein